jgi:hypothetical protein
VFWIEGLCLNGRIVFEASTTRTEAGTTTAARSAFVLSLTDPRERRLVLCLPLVEAATAVGRRETRTALGFDDLDVICTFAAALDEFLLLAVPFQLLVVPLSACKALIGGEIKGRVRCLLGKGGTIL